MNLDQQYELYLILHPELNKDAIDTAITDVTALLEKQVSATEITVENEGLKKLAYTIKKSHTGTYILFTFTVAHGAKKDFNTLEKKLNLLTPVIRYIVVNQTDYNKQKSKEVQVKSEFSSHRDFNKGKQNNKKCYPTYLGMRVVDYKDAEFLSQFVSPYSKIFVRSKTGTSAKMQRKIDTAIKRARHMALLSFTPQYRSH